MTDTPETDDLARGNHVVPTEFAEQMERKRDEWKAKYLQQNKDLGYELLDPCGTIWSECKRLQNELATVTEQRDEDIRSCHIWQKGHAELVAERDKYWDQADYFLDQLGHTQMRMYDAERKLKKITEALEYIIGIGLTEKTKAKAEKALQTTQEANKICAQIYIARNISLSEKDVLSALTEIDKLYRDEFYN